MDQPPQQTPQFSTEGIIASILSVVATLGAIAVRGRLRIKGMREKVEAETAPNIQKENIEWSEGLIDRWKDDLKAAREEFAAFRKEAREEIARERDRAEVERQRADDWQTRAMSCESQNQLKDFKIARLEERVTELERHVAEARGRREDVR